MTETGTTSARSPVSFMEKPASGRVVSIDALRGLVMFTMIFVNDLAGGGEIVPNWMVHFSERHHGGSGMTFVDLVFPAFLFIVGMSIPFALGARIDRGEPLGKTLWHIITRTLALLAIGILMVNGESGGSELWHWTMYLSSILAFCSIAPRKPDPASGQFWKTLSFCLGLLGFAGMIYCAFSFVSHKGQHIIRFSPFRIRTEWYGILGLIGWAYLAASAVYLVFRTSRTALLGCVALMFCFYPAERMGAFDHFWFAQHVVSFADTIGSHGAIAVSGILLASALLPAAAISPGARMRFAALFAGGFAAAALLTNGLYGISKNEATPSWCLWSCAITAVLWMAFYYICDIAEIKRVAKPLSLAGQNVLLAYLLSEMLPNPLGVIPWDGVLAWVIARSLLWACALLCLTVGLNRLGFRLRI